MGIYCDEEICGLKEEVAIYKKALELACYRIECSNLHMEHGRDKAICSKPELECNKCWQEYYLMKAKETRHD